MFIIFDLDGTLADIGHRLAHLQKDPKDWDRFYNECPNDQPIEVGLEVLRTLRYRHYVQIWTGRSERIRDLTIAWLKSYGIEYVPLIMRAEGDHRPDHVLKQEWLHSCVKKPDLVFEDRASVVAMWRAEGIPCFQVAPGDF